MLEARTAGPAHRIGRYQRRGVCLCVLSAAVLTPHAICRPVHLIIKINLLNTKLQYFIWTKINDTTFVMSYIPNGIFRWYFLST